MTEHHPTQSCGFEINFETGAEIDGMVPTCPIIKLFSIPVESSIPRFKRNAFLSPCCKIRTPVLDRFAVFFLGVG